MIDPASAKFAYKAGVEYELVFGASLLKHTFHGIPITIALSHIAPRTKPRVSQKLARMHVSQEGSGSHAMNPQGSVRHEPRGTVSWMEPPKE